MQKLTSNEAKSWRGRKLTTRSCVTGGAQAWMKSRPRRSSAARAKLSASVVTSFDTRRLSCCKPWRRPPGPPAMYAVFTTFFLAGAHRPNLHFNHLMMNVDGQGEYES